MKIIDCENNEKMRTVVEAIHFRMGRPGLNRQGGYDLPPVYMQLFQGGERGNQAKTGEPF